MTGMHDHATGQSHVKAVRPSRILKDTEDVSEMKRYFEDRFIFNPFVVSHELKNICTGLVSPDNVYNAFNIGCEMINDITGKNPLTYKVSKTVLAVQMPKTSVVHQINEEVPDPNVLFQRALVLSCSPDSDVTFEDFLRYELSPLPLSLFTEHGFLRSNNKAELSNHLTQGYEVSTSTLVLNQRYWTTVIDGGGLLHNVVWNPESSIMDILSQYIQYININYKRFSISLTVVFDGYCSSTKDHCHRRRTPIKGLATIFDNDTIISKKAAFLSNPENKQPFIDLLSETLQADGIDVIQ